MAKDPIRINLDVLAASYGIDTLLSTRIVYVGGRPVLVLVPVEREKK